jgi:hypothetical protein
MQTQKNKHNEAPTPKSYPVVSLVLGILLSLGYTGLLVTATRPPELVFEVMILLVYWGAMFYAEGRFSEGSITVAKVRLINIGGFFLYFFASFGACLSGLRIGG